MSKSSGGISFGKIVFFIIFAVSLVFLAKMVIWITMGLIKWVVVSIIILSVMSFLFGGSS